MSPCPDLIATAAVVVLDDAPACGAAMGLALLFLPHRAW
jgi:hypothetical protein